jgi:hypothetical protein
MTVMPDLQCFIYIPEDERSTNHTDPPDKPGAGNHADKPATFNGVFKSKIVFVKQKGRIKG